MRKGILLFMIGPVQTFIAEARKLKDLYAGSRLLSHCIGEVAVYLEKRTDVKLIFPQPGYPSMPNRIIFTFHYEQESEITALAETLSRTARNAIKKIAQDLAQEYKIHSPYFDEDIDQLLEIYWTARELSDYSKDYRLLQTEMRRIKRLRTFVYRSFPSGKTCSLSPGKRAVFGVEGVQNLMADGVYLKRQHETVLKKNEVLSSAAFIKRFMKSKHLSDYDPNFPSVGYIAVGRRLEDIKVESWNADIANGVLESLGGNRLGEGYSRKDRESIQDIIRQIKANNISITPYYAVIQFDGDSIGDLFNHANLLPTKKMEDFHRHVSDQIMEFAKGVKERMQPQEGGQPKEGVIVYAGGEDFLGFVSLDRLLPVLQEFRNRFSKIDISEYVSDQKLTFSAGVTIAHYKERLGDVMSDVNQAEHFAKQIDQDKDAAAFFLNIRGGETVKARIKFGQNCGNLKLLQTIIENLQMKKVSNSLIYNLQASVKKMRAEWTAVDDDKQALETEEQTIGKELVYFESARLLKANTKDEDLENLLESFKKLLDENSINDYLNWLTICTFFQGEVLL